MSVLSHRFNTEKVVFKVQTLLQDKHTDKQARTRAVADSISTTIEKLFYFKIDFKVKLKLLSTIFK